MTLDAAVVSGNLYKTVFENDKVRILRWSYGPYERGVMHSHPDSAIVCLTDMNATFNYPDGRAEEVLVPAGVAFFLPANTHLPEVKTPNRSEGIIVELKR